MKTEACKNDFKSVETHCFSKWIGESASFWKRYNMWTARNGDTTQMLLFFNIVWMIGETHQKNTRFQTKMNYF